MIRISILLTAMLLAAGAVAEPPRLVLQITVDGLRADLIDRYQKNFGKGGFNYLLENGAVFTNARYLHANTETIVGHTTLATGATPAVHGMVGNVWYHAENGELGYNIEDPDAPLLPTRESAAAGAQVDPAQLKARTMGRSPRAILAPTLSDTLKISAPGNAKVFGISGKDRSAVAMAGKVGTAYWYSTDTGDFQTSVYYMDSYPQWVSTWNGERKAEALGDTNWKLLLDTDRYLLAGQDDRPYEIDLKGFGRTFPHAYGPANHPLFFTRLLVSPAGDQLLADFGKQLIESEQLGADGDTDYLSVSFSGGDAVNHFFGPSSLENEDTVLQLDRTLADFLAYVDKKVGLEHTLIVLSADHGMAEMPEYATERGFPAGRLNLDHGVLVEKLAAALTGMEGVAAAVPSARAKSLEQPAVAHNHHPTRSGDIYIYQDPHWFLFDRGAIGVMHGSPWAYDQHVPLIFAGPGVVKGNISRLVHPIDVAPTMSHLLKLPPPASAQGKVLPEVTAQ